jgi:hypothetical protein
MNSSKKRFLRIFFFVVLPLFLIIMPMSIILLTFQKSPLISESKLADVDDATRVRSLAKNTYESLFQSTDNNSISASQDDLNAVMAFMTRAVPRFAGRAVVTPMGLAVAGTLRMPANPVGNYINVYVSLGPSESDLNIRKVVVGRIKLPGPLAHFLLRFSLDMALGEQQGTMLVNSVQSTTFHENSVFFNMQAMPKFGFKRMKYLKERFKGVRDYIAPLGDPAVVSIYYRKLLELGHVNHDRQFVSLARFVQPVFQLAQQRSFDSDHVTENHAAIMALSMYAGSPRFEHLIGSVRPEEMKSSWPNTRNVVLGGRKDLKLHFLLSAGLKLVSDSGISYAAGEFKELLDASYGGTGFSFADLAADRAGIRFAEIATDASGGASRLQYVLSQKVSETLFFPNVADLPEGLPQAEFETVYGGIANDKYVALVNKIDQRIDHLPAYLQPGTANLVQ